MVWGKLLKAQMWDHYINKNNHISYSSLVDAIMLHHDVSYDPTIFHIDLYGKVNDEGVYYHFMTVKICLLSTDIRFAKRVRRFTTPYRSEERRE